MRASKVRNVIMWRRPASSSWSLSRPDHGPTASLSRLSTRMILKARSRMSSGAQSTGGRRTSPAGVIGTSLKSGVPPGRTAGSGTWKERGPKSGMRTLPVDGLVTILSRPATCSAPFAGAKGHGKCTPIWGRRSLNLQHTADVALALARCTMSRHSISIAKISVSLIVLSMALSSASAQTSGSSGTGSSTGTSGTSSGSGTSAGTSSGSGTSAGTSGTSSGTSGSGTSAGTSGSGTSAGTSGSGTSAGTSGSGTSAGTSGSGTSAGTSGSGTSA